MTETERYPELETVIVSRLAVATAVDRLSAFEREFEQADADGPYREEISETIDQLAASLDAEKTYGLFAGDRQDPDDFYVLLGGPVSVENPSLDRAEIKDVVITTLRQEYNVEGGFPPEETFVAELPDFPE